MADILDFNDTINGEITIWSNPIDPKPKCGCRHPTKKRTSWTVPNPTQRFFNGLFSMVRNHSQGYCNRDQMFFFFIYKYELMILCFYRHLGSNVATLIGLILSLKEIMHTTR